MAIPARISKQIAAFLSKRSESTGGYAPVAEDEVDALRAIVQGLVEAKYEADPDGDLPLNVQIVDRTRQQGFYFRPLPRLKGKDENDLAALGRVLQAASANLSVAQRDMELAVRDLEMRAIEPASQGRPVACNGRSMEPHHWLVSTQALRERAGQELAAYVAEHAPLEGTPDDYAARMQWQALAGKAIGQALGTAAIVALGRLRDGRSYAGVDLVGYVAREGDRPIRLVLDAIPAQARSMRPAPAP